MALLLVAMAFGLVLLPGTAWAGGPTSVLLTSPGTDRAAGLYASDPAYQQLARLLVEQPVAGPAPPDLSAGGSYVNVTWLVHDVSIWRVDRVFTTAQGDLWVATWTTQDAYGPLATGGIDPGSSENAVVHRPGDAATLRALIDDLGLLSGTPVAATPAAAVTPAPATGRDGEWWWAAAGALVGGAAVALALRGSDGLRRRVLATGRRKHGEAGRARLP